MCNSYHFDQVNDIFSFSDVPMESGRFLGDLSGMAEFVGNNSVIFCRHRLELANKYLPFKQANLNVISPILH